MITWLSFSFICSLFVFFCFLLFFFFPSFFFSPTNVLAFYIIFKTLHTTTHIPLSAFFKYFPHFFCFPIVFLANPLFFPLFFAPQLIPRSFSSILHFYTHRSLLTWGRGGGGEQAKQDKMHHTHDTLGGRYSSFIFFVFFL